MKKSLKFLGALGFLAVSSGASAIQYVWDLDAGPQVNPGSGQTNTAVCNSGIECQLTYTSLSGSQTLYARAYSTPGDSTSGNFLSANIARYGSGLGIANTVGTDAGEFAEPEHAVDNEGARDVLILEAPTANFAWESLSVGWFRDDSDIQLYVGGSGANSGPELDFRNLCFTGCTNTSNRIQDAASGFTDLGLFTNVGQNGGTISNVAANLGSGGSAVGRYLVVAGALEGNYLGARDYFKVSAVTGHKVPVPATAALLLVGLAGMVWTRRKGRTIA